ncbi:MULTISPECIES: hypothetical protein [Streptomyces]|uniref:hypothetical protein n=1 Tax=Streptomyces TaxID=1883 RepID=UPI00163BBC32|nr:MULTISPECIES: hypothetical protein [Streptomyces]MBC2879093.1 hypothetical protein [Streptomyces sp. TYQ1024]UBI36054.1 hypothetical protein K7I03_05975 [Streptomyces mobaraensis]UKW28648.1 hypothetical protein MCU78_05965 [Streptomyces sp. TYQ1024]
MTEPTSAGKSAEDLAKQVMPAILELQRVLRPHTVASEAQEVRGYISLTSCQYLSCGPGGGGTHPTVM